MKSRKTRITLWSLGAAAILAGGAVAMNHGPESFAGRVWTRIKGEVEFKKTTGMPHAPRVEIVPGQPDAIRFTDEAVNTLGIRTVEVEPAPPPEPLRLPGELQLDPNRLVRVHSRFTGELVKIGTVGENGSSRPLQFGDKVKRGDVLAVVWSKEIGEKKSELVDAYSKLAADEKLLKAMESVAEGAIPRRQIIDARRNVEADVIAQAKAERTLRSWRLTEAEMAAIYREADSVLKRQADTADDKSWAELEIKAPIDGRIVEKNFNEGAIVDPDDDLFQIADLSHLLVLANVYEEDLPALRRLEPGHRNWLVDLKSDPHDNGREGVFDLLAPIIDRESHTGFVMGRLDNSNETLAAGQFITATIVLPADPTVVSIPSSALIEEGSGAYVLVESNAERHEFTRRKVAVKRRWRHSVYVCRDTGTPDRDCPDSLKVGERVVVTGVLELSAEIDAVQSRHAEQEAE